MTTQAELREELKEEVKGLTSYLTDPTDYDNAIDSAESETWTLPQSSTFKVYWIKERAKRHLFFYLMSEAAHKYKVKRFNLNERFDHYYKLINKMDEDFLAIQESRPEEFASVDSYKMFGTKISAGFRYNDVGKDITYEDENLVEFNPNDSD